MVITNIYTNQRIILKYNNVINFAIFENFDTYNIIILSSENNGNLITYHSDFITNNGVSNDFSYLESFSNSFKQVMVPANVNKIGYYQEKNDSQKLPLFISTSEDHYILNIDETINKY